MPLEGNSVSKYSQQKPLYKVCCELFLSVLRHLIRYRYTTLWSALVSTSLCYGYHLDLASHKWGVFFTHRSSNNPFELEKHPRYDIFPLVFFQHRDFYIHGLDMGYRLKRQSNYELRLVSRYRFFDAPRQQSGFDRDDGANFGLEVHHISVANLDTYISLLSDLDGRLVSELGTEYYQKIWDSDVHLYAKIQAKSRRYNRRYFGLEQEDPGSDIDTSLGFDIKRSIYKNFYATVAGEITYYGGKTVAHSQAKRPYQERFIFGAGLMPDPKEENTQDCRPRCKISPYLRLGHGFATPTNTNVILSGGSEPDDHNNKLNSLFLGVPLHDHLFGTRIQAYFSAGYAAHHPNAHQGLIHEGVLLIKLFYPLALPIEVRLGLGEGLSYVSYIPDIEQREMTRLALDPSNLLNYLDYSVDFALHDLLPRVFTKKAWLGWYLHHRSGIYSTSALFNRVRGGSNFNTIALTWEL